MILFLDFDGVLHPEVVGVANFCKAPILWQVLRVCQHVDVVFSTSWRETYPKRELVEFVTRGGGEVLSRRFIGTTPCPETARALWGRIGVKEVPTDGYRVREYECRLWRHLNRALDRPWLAIDDHAHWFEVGLANLYVVDARHGLREEDVPRLIGRLECGVGGKPV